MTISSIHFQKAEVEFAEKHNFRTEQKEPKYLLDTQYRKTNEYLKLNDPKELYQEQMQLRKQNHCRGFAPHLKDVFWEAVVNLDEKHNLADVKKVADFIQQKYHIQTCSIALHHDEGYKDKDGTVKYNHHAHICFLTMDNGISTMRKIRSKELRQMQTDVAQLLGLERGKENSKTTRLDHKQYREKAKELERAELKHNQELAEVEQKQKQAEAVLQLVKPALQRSVEEKKQLNSTAKRLNNKVLSLKAKKAIIEAERKRWKNAHDFVVDEYRKLQDLKKSMFTEEQLTAKIQELRDAHALRLKAVKATQKAKLKIQKARLKNALDDNTVLKNKNTELQEKLETKPKEVPRQLTDSEIEELSRVKELKTQNTELTQQRDNLIKFNSTVLEVIKAMYSDFDLERPIQSLKKIYTDWKTQQQKSSITALKRSQNNESIRERVDVQQNSQSQSMSIFERKSEVKEYELIINGTEYVMTAKEMKEAIADDTFSQKQIESALTDEQRAEVFGEPQQKQSLFSRVKHSLER